MRRANERARGPNQSMLRVRTLAEQSDRGSDLHILSGQVRSNTSLVGFLRHASPIGSASLSSCSSYLTTLHSRVVTVNTQCLLKQRLPFLSLESQLRLETTRGYCWRLVFLGL